MTLFLRINAVNKNKTNVMEYFIKSSFGYFICQLFSKHFTKKGWESFTTLAYGWSLSKTRHTIANYLWLSGGVKYKHFSQYYIFIGGTFKNTINKLWATLLLQLDSHLPLNEKIELVVDDTTRKKSGKNIDGASNYRNGAGSARQEFRFLWGINFVYVILQFNYTINNTIQKLSFPIGLRLYLKKDKAEELDRDYHTRSKLARQIIDFVANTLPHRKILVKADGGYSTKEFFKGIPEKVDSVGRFPVDSRLFDIPPKRKKTQLGRKPDKGKDLGSPKEWKKQKGWEKHPNEKGAYIKTKTGIWHSVIPGKQMKVIVVWRKNFNAKDKRSGKKELESFFSTDLQMTAHEILDHYHQRWDVEIDIKDGYGYYGLGKDQCRRLDRIYGINSFKILMAACRSLWFVKQFKNEHLDLTINRPWYRKKTKPTQLDIISASQEALSLEGIFPIPRYFEDVGEIKKCAINTEKKKGRA